MTRTSANMFAAVAAVVLTVLSFQQAILVPTDGPATQIVELA